MYFAWKNIAYRVKQRSKVSWNEIPVVPVGEMLFLQNKEILSSKQGVVWFFTAVMINLFPVCSPLVLITSKNKCCLWEKV